MLGMSGMVPAQGMSGMVPAQGMSGMVPAQGMLGMVPAQGMLGMLGMVPAQGMLGMSGNWDMALARDNWDMALARDNWDILDGLCPTTSRRGVRRRHHPHHYPSAFHVFEILLQESPAKSAQNWLFLSVKCPSSLFSCLFVTRDKHDPWSQRKNPDRAGGGKQALHQEKSVMAYPRDIVLDYAPRSPVQPRYVKPSLVDFYDDTVPVIFLDLDNTLISAVDSVELGEREIRKLVGRYGRYKKIDPYYVFPRKHLDYFLERLFASYRVGVWTAASKDYAHHVVSEFIIKPDPSRVLETFLWRDHTNYASNKGWGFKDLRALTREFGYNDTMEDSYIVDDNEMVWNTQPDRTLKVRPFEATDADQGGESLLNVLDILDSTVRYGIAFPPITGVGL